MDPTISQRMLAKLRQSMNIPSLPPEEQAQCELKLKLTAKIDHILYTEWDPIGVHLLTDFDCDDEYHRYLPRIVDLVFDGAPVQEIAEALFEIELMIFGEGPQWGSSQRRCDEAAVMVSRYGPHAANNPFVVRINTDTAADAYQSVLDLVTQTRVDAYEKNWPAVRDNYEQAIAIIATHLPKKLDLFGACLNNFGVAYCHTQQLEQAIDAFDRAAIKLTPAAVKESRFLFTCLNNAINCHEHQGHFAAILPYLERIHRFNLKHVGKRYMDTHQAWQRLKQARKHDRKRPALKPKRIDVEKDGCGYIQNVIYID
ncbi:MAG: hypothetical protein K9K38_05615 [Rhodoferax sp.]|nr:hypothetical protein [Rhodoferax sp.]